MNEATLALDLEAALREIPMFDAHTHLVGGRLAAEGLHDILLYHMVVSDLHAAGCPNGARLTQYPSRPSEEEAHARIEEAIPYLPLIENTSMYWALRRLLADLYGWKEPIRADNWRELDQMIREGADDPTWPRAVISRLRIPRLVTEIARRGEGRDDDKLQYSLEWGFFTRCQWGEFDTALHELERCWGRDPSSPSPIGAGPRPPVDREIRTVEDVHEAVAHYVGAIPYAQVLSTATHISCDIDWQDVDRDTMAGALSRRSTAGPLERDIYASYVQEAFLAALEERGKGIVYQFSFGAEPLPHETASRLSQRTIGQVAQMIARHPRLRFQCFLACRHANQALCTLARELPNLSLCGIWWHNFFPDVMRQVFRERLDMLPVSKQIGFFSDAYVIEWTHAKATVIRHVLARVLAERVSEGWWSRADALRFARAILHDSPASLLGMVPAGS